MLHPQLAQDTIVLTDLPLSRLLLCNDANYPWFILVPKIADIEEIYQLDWPQQQQLLNESSLLSELLMLEYSGDKMNIAALGNVVAQLHIHHIVRYKKDACWPKPIWGQQAMKPYTPEQINDIKAKILPKLAKIIG